MLMAARHSLDVAPGSHSRRNSENGLRLRRSSYSFGSRLQTKPEDEPRRTSLVIKLGNLSVDGASVKLPDEGFLECIPSTVSGVPVAESRREKKKRRKPPKGRSAEKKKIDGNELYKRREYTQAIKLYTEAIELFPHCAPYYSNRSACYMMLGKYTKALSDARESVRLDPISAKNYVRIAKCHVALGDPNAAQAVLRQTAELQADDQAVKEETANAEALQRLLEEVNKAVGRKDYRMAIYQLDQTLKLASGCSNLRITKAEYLAFLKRYGEAQEIVNDILQFDSTNVDALYVRGMCLYYQSNPEAAFTHFQHVLRMAPDHKKAKDIYKKAKLIQQKKAEGNEAFKKGTLTEALAIYTEALSIDPNNTATNSKLYCNRATVRAKLGKMDAAVEDCTAAINLDEGYVKAYLRRAKCFQEQGKHEEAVRDYEKVLKLDRNQDHKRFLQEAKVLLKKSKLKDYYTILGISKTATEDEIKKSYKKMALQHHPDRHTNATDIEKQDHEVKFKEIGEAYTVLTDAKKKAMYDKGQDINDPDCGFYGDDFDATRLFQTLFTPRDGEFIFTAEDFPGGAAGTTDYNFSTGFPGNGGFRFRF